MGVDLWLEELGVGPNEIDFVDLASKATVYLRHAGHGSRQVLAMITQLFLSKPGSIIMIEEPELSLHPDVQLLLPEVFADAVREGRQIL